MPSNLSRRAINLSGKAGCSAHTGHGVSSSSDKATFAHPEASSDLISMSSSCSGETPITRKQLPLRLVLGLPTSKETQECSLVCR